MPDKRIIQKAREDKREGKSASTQAGEFVHEEIDKIRRTTENVHARSFSITLPSASSR